MIKKVEINEFTNGNNTESFLEFIELTEDISVQLQEIYNTRGYFYPYVKIRGWQMAIKFAYLNSSASGFDTDLRDMKAKLIQQDSLDITVWDSSDNEYFSKCVIQQVVLPSEMGKVDWGRIAIRGVVLEPFKGANGTGGSDDGYLETINSVSTSGFSVPHKISWALGTLSGGQSTITNNGNMAWYPKVRVQNCNTPTVGNDTTGESFTLNMNVTSYVDIYWDDGLKVVDSAGESQLVNFEGELFKLAVGDNDINFSSSTGTCKVWWYDYFSSI